MEYGEAMAVEEELIAAGRSGTAGCDDDDGRGGAVLDGSDVEGGVDVVGGGAEATAPLLSQGFGGDTMACWKLRMSMKVGSCDRAEASVKRYVFIRKIGGLRFIQIGLNGEYNYNTNK